MLEASPETLCSAYDMAMLDLDGVVYIGGEAVPGAAESLARARDAGLRLAFITNNASRPPEAVSAHLSDLGVPADVEDVVTSAQAAARVLADRFGAGARVVCLGAVGLEQALREAGLEPVGADDDAVAVATGYGPDVLWSSIMRVAVRVRDGLPWVASNTDRTFPAPFGVAPGHGVQVSMLSDFTGVAPVVAGKPERPLLDETVRRLGGRRPLMVGDRLDTDIEGARRAGIDSLLVLTGVTELGDMVSAAPELRPTYLAPDLRGLLTPHGATQVDDRGAVRLGGWVATVDEGRLRVEADADADADADEEPAAADWWRVAATAAWEHLDATGEPARTDGVAPPSTPVAG